MRRKIRCSQDNCVNNVDGYCQSWIRNWLGVCVFKRKPKPEQTPTNDIGISVNKRAET